MTSVAFDHDLVELFGDEPELLAIADAIAATQSARRLRPAGRRRVALAVAAALAIVVAAPALGLHRTLVSFFESEPAPERTQIEFARMGIAAPVGLGPNVIHEETRRVLERELDGKLRSLYVAPTRSGGFCWLWEGRMGSCGRTRPEQRALGVTWQESASGPTLIAGHVLDPAIERLELRYEDGGQIEIPIVWVSPPIDAGFYAYEVAPETLSEGRRATFLVALDGDGDDVARHEFRYQDPRWESGPDGLPKIADRSQLRTLFDFRARNGAQWQLRVAPAPGDKLCYAYNAGGGCRSPKFPGSLLNLGVQGGSTSVFICCETGSRTASVELGFEDGDRIRLETVEGFLLYEVPPEHYPLGYRLDELVSFDATGRELERRRIEPSRGVYPCAKGDELDLGFELTICP
jgi:hypothetical protein